MDQVDAHPAAPQGRPAVEDASRGRRLTAWIVFALIASFVVVSDQLLKLWIVANYKDKIDVPSPILGDWLRIDYIHNSGGLFGMLQGSAQAFAVVTVAVVAVLVALEVRSAWRSWLLTLALALLLGGAIGNLIDRIRLGYVVDFADIGIGTWRFYTFNVADSAVTVSVLVLLLLWLVTPTLERSEDAGPEKGEPVEGAGSPGIEDGPAVG